MVRQSRVRTAAEISNSFGPQQSSNVHESSYLTNLGVGDRIPGFRTSAAFFTSLRANLRLNETTDPFLSPASDMSSSAASTPPTLPANPSSLPPPSPLATAVTPAPYTSADSNSNSDPHPNQNPLASIPELHTYATTSTEDRVAALRLIADSVAQQRQFASRALIFHPLALGSFMAVLAVVAQLLYKTPSDLPLVGTTWAGLVMAGLVSVRWAVGGYIQLAEEIGWGWMNGGGDGVGEAEEDVCVVSRWGDDVIGALVLRFVRDDGAGGGSGGGSGGGKGRRNKGARGRGLIRAWTVKLRTRGKGVGTGLLEEAVRICRERGVEGPEFASGHANSGRILPALFNAGFDRRERDARKALDEVIDAQATPTTGTRKR